MKASSTTPLLVSDCFEVKLTTKRYGSQNSWSLGLCQSAGDYGWYDQYTQQCCLSLGIYNLECKNSRGNGWDGGYIEVKGTKYCEGFTSGTEYISEIPIHGRGKHS